MADLQGQIEAAEAQHEATRRQAYEARCQRREIILPELHAWLSMIGSCLSFVRSSKPIFVPKPSCARSSSATCCRWEIATGSSLLRSCSDFSR